MHRDLRVSVLGGSFIAGAGDPEHQGWVRRLCARAGAAADRRRPRVRRETSLDVLARWAAECRPRLALRDGTPTSWSPCGTTETWRREVAGGDGAHRPPSGHRIWVDPVWPRWDRWLREAGHHR